MLAEDFGNLLDNVMLKIYATLDGKAEQYARGDRLSNFRSAARIADITPERALIGMELKHRTAIYDYVDDLDVGAPSMPVAQWEEKIIDSINYLILLLALVTERADGQAETVKTINKEEQRVWGKLEKESNLAYVEDQNTGD